MPPSLFPQGHPLSHSSADRVLLFGSFFLVSFWTVAPAALVVLWSYLLPFVRPCSCYPHSSPISRNSVWVCAGDWEETPSLGGLIPFWLLLFPLFLCVLMVLDRFKIHSVICPSRVPRSTWGVYSCFAVSSCARYGGRGAVIVGPGEAYTAALQTHLSSLRSPRWLDKHSVCLGLQGAALHLAHS